MIPVKIWTVNRWKRNLREYGTVTKHRERSIETKQVPDLQSASMDARLGSREHNRALKRRQIEDEIVECRSMLSTNSINKPK